MTNGHFPSIEDPSGHLPLLSYGILQISKTGVHNKGERAAFIRARAKALPLLPSSVARTALAQSAQRPEPLMKYAPFRAARRTPASRSARGDPAACWAVYDTPPPAEIYENGRVIIGGCQKGRDPELNGPWSMLWRSPGPGPGRRR